MAEPVVSLFPAALDDNTSLLADVVDLESWALSGSHTSGVTTITVTTTISGVSAPIYLRIENEIIHAAGISGNQFTGCARGADGTTPAAHSSSQPVYHVYTANYFNQLKRAIIATQTELGVAPKTIDDTVSPGASPASVAAYLDMVANILKTLAASASWYTATSIAASAVSMPKVGSPTIDTLAEDFTTRGSSGVVDGTLTYITVDTGDHKVKVAAGEGYLRTTNDQQGELKLIAWAEMTQIDIPAPAANQETTRFIGIEYNSGTPQVTSRTTFNWNWYTDFPLGRVSYDGATLHILNAYAHTEDIANLARRYLRLVLPFQREVAPEGTGGLELTEVATRQLSMTGGNMWHGFNNYVLASIAAGTAFDLHYRSAGGGFVYNVTATQWPNTQYDDGTGTLHTMTNNKYACLWVYLDISDGTLNLLYGRNEYNSAALAQAEVIPTPIPAHLQYHGRLIARIIFQKSASAATLIESAWATTFSGSLSSSIFNDAEGDPAATSPTTAADGTSGFAARRDHVHVSAPDIVSGPQAFGDNYVVTVSVSSNNLTVALKTIAGADFSVSIPFNVRIGNTMMNWPGALSTTKNAGTNWCNGGSSEHKTQDVDYFVYAIHETGAFAGVSIGFSRIPWARVMGDFVNTTTSEKYIAGNWTNFTATDEVECIGRFNAANSGTASFNWSIPATPIVVSRPIHHTRWLTWAPTYGGITSPSTAYAKYQLHGFKKCTIENRYSGTISGTPATITATVPFEAANSANAPACGVALWSDATSSGSFGGLYIGAGSPDTIASLKYNGANWSTSPVSNGYGEYETE